MISRPLWYIAGVDRETLSTCPQTDKLWATHLGFSLVLSFLVVLGISFHATGYVIADVWMRLAASTIVALTVFMFDRALYQSDWFVQGVLQQPSGGSDDARVDVWRSARRFFRITIRLTILFALAWIIALFLELAIFDDTIGEKIKSDHLIANKPVYDKIESYETQLNREIEERRTNLAQLEELYRRQLAVAPVPDAAPVDRSDYEQHMRILDGQEQELRRELRQIEAKISGYAEEMNERNWARRSARPTAAAPARAQGTSSRNGKRRCSNSSERAARARSRSLMPGVRTSRRSRDAWRRRRSRAATKNTTPFRASAPNCSRA